MTEEGYVASVTRVYREALNRIAEGAPPADDAERRYNLEMAFSRGLHTGWFEGIDNQRLVPARFGKKRGAYLGEVRRVEKESVRLRLETPLKPGDGVVFDSGNPEAKEEGGRVYAVRQEGKETVVAFGRRDIDWRRVRVGDKLWKTSDPELDKRLRQSFAGDTPQFQRPLSLEVYGKGGEKLTLVARDELGNCVALESEIPLAAARTQPLTTERLQQQLGRLGNTGFYLKDLTNRLEDGVMLPTSELNRMRREIVDRVQTLRRQPPRWELRQGASLRELLPTVPGAEARKPAQLAVLSRDLTQLETVLEAGMTAIYCDFEDPRRYREAVRIARGQRDVEIFVVPPRITKPGENYLLQQVRSCNADGYLIRNYDHLQFFTGERCIGDFSLNVANPLTADYFKQSFNLERLTASYDLNIEQLEGLLQASPPQWYEVTIHQHMPMFHMEHCVFCAFLSAGTDYTNCGRPCEKHEVKLRDYRSKNGSEHILKADAGCRNTVFNGKAQTGAEYVQRLLNLGVRYFRIEFVNETRSRVRQTVQLYQQLLAGEINGSQLWQELKLQNQLGVTRGTLGK